MSNEQAGYPDPFSCDNDEVLMTVLMDVGWLLLLKLDFSGGLQSTN